MKTYINLGIAFIDTYGSRRLSFQLMPAGARAAVATADFERGALRRSHKSDKLTPYAFASFMATVRGLADDSAVKSLEWSYPSSPNAEARGFADGCWTLDLSNPGLPGHAVRAFAPDAKGQAVDCLKSLPFPLSAISASLHPEFVTT